MANYTDEEKIRFFDEDWKYIERIISVLQAHNVTRPGDNLLEWLANWLERNFG